MILFYELYPLQGTMLKHWTLTSRNKVCYLGRSIVMKCQSPPLQWCSPAKQFAKLVDKKSCFRGAFIQYFGFIIMKLKLMKKQKDKRHFVSFQRRKLTMKKYNRLRNFSLIELLIAIAIIAILSAMLMPVVSHLTTTAKKTKAKAEMQSIITAIKSYESTYGILPFSGAETVMDRSDDDDYDNMMDTLTNVPAGSNSRSIRFLDVPDGYTTNGYLDPWGNKYFIYLDTDYDGEIANVGPAGNITNPAYGTVFIYSTGKNGTDDYVYSWK